MLTLRWPFGSQRSKSNVCPHIPVGRWRFVSAAAVSPFTLDVARRWQREGEVLTC